MYNHIELNDILGHPQDFNGIYVYPIKLFDRETETIMKYVLYRNEEEFLNFLKFGKDGYANILRAKTYLKKYILYNFHESTHSLLMAMYNIKLLLSKVLKVEKDDISIFGGNINNGRDILNKDLVISIKIGEKVFEISDYEFDELRICILRQNGLSIKYIETPYKEDLDNLLVEENRDFGVPSFSDCLFTFVSMANISVNDEMLKEYTLYQFERHFDRLKKIESYKTHFPLYADGKIKNNVEHYLKPYTEKGRYDSILLDKNEFSASDMGKNIDSLSK